MYDEWAGYWPTSVEQPFADFINGVRKVVVTSSPLMKAWNNAEAVSGRIEDVVQKLKAEPGGDIGVHGSITLARSCSMPGWSTNSNSSSGRSSASVVAGCSRALTPRVTWS
jgi:dihydrofolate reductase